MVEVCTGAYLCLGTMLAFLRFTNVDPQELRLDFSFLTSYTTLSRNEMHDLNKID
jgi:hypothetical protein